MKNKTDLTFWAIIMLIVAVILIIAAINTVKMLSMLLAVLAIACLYIFAVLTWFGISKHLNDREL